MFVFKVKLCVTEKTTIRRSFELTSKMDIPAQELVYDWMSYFFSYNFLRCVFRPFVPVSAAFDTMAVIVVTSPFKLAKPFLDLLSIFAFVHIFRGT